MEYPQGVRQSATILFPDPPQKKQTEKNAGMRGRGMMCTTKKCEFKSQVQNVHNEESMQQNVMINRVMSVSIKTFFICV